MPHELKVLSSNTLMRAAKMPGGARQRIEIGRRICEVSAQQPGQLLDYGISVLRALPIKSLPLKEHIGYYSLLGLLSWAHAQGPSKEQFDLAWHDLLALYPATPGFWRKQIEAVLNRFFETESSAHICQTYFGPPYEPFKRRQTIDERRTACSTCSTG